ncbi:Class I SAM-dependent methyltransferase [Rhodovastum atsumiense]|uniref:Class I SAM-dependent methyltransferase n=1 Tax=Rhodovastum atsumiense TaxID=504468 RepID=A0A5M6IRX3_9PROT|nr:SAM-dependent methyltransferase [Rhodovastum atsumiense]KAA5611043.1 class I SAM-dependent methyltransferase [Rhodovastum atsumiense]CAH2600170.1 Class I SAM-dependent methyltransferase [Rhodovastum atsumiense]
MERLDAFMARANAAYYAARDPFADFTTAPEISQAFGEVLGLWAAVTWQAMGSPDPVILAEAGPGRGTLMADALRAIARAVPAFRAALRLHLVETSPRLRALQAGRLPGAVWHDRIADLPAGPLILIGNEFLDALPIRQFLRRGAGWAERWVADGAFAERPADAPEPPCPPATEDEVVEICEPARALAAALGARLVAQGGAALFVDYGPAASMAGDSLQALRDGAPAPPLADPGTADLTAHVDFAALATLARAAGAAAQGPVPQGLFLARLGLPQRVEALARTQPPAAAAALLAGTRRLTEPHAMGRLFKALALCHPALPSLPGFA